MLPLEGELSVKLAVTFALLIYKSLGAKEARTWGYFLNCSMYDWRNLHLKVILLVVVCLIDILPIRQLESIQYVLKNIHTYIFNLIFLSWFIPSLPSITSIHTPPSPQSPHWCPCPWVLALFLAFKTDGPCEGGFSFSSARSLDCPRGCLHLRMGYLLCEIKIHLNNLVGLYIYIF